MAEQADYYHFRLRIKSANFPERHCNVWVKVVTSEEGDVIFSIADIYTGTPRLDANGNQVTGADGRVDLIAGLSGARVVLQREFDQSYVNPVNTDANGEAVFQGLPAGSYKYRITVNNHQEKIGRIWIKPGLITTEAVFLDYNLVTVEWSVTETTIQDKYEVVLTTTFETNVPAAVVVASPSSVNLPPMRAGDVFKNLKGSSLPLTFALKDDALWGVGGQVRF